jgi:hypothetical protein
MSIIKYISIPTFLVSLVIGLILVYIFETEQKVITVYPTPDNAGQIQYQDKAGNCYKYSATEATCPTNFLMIKTIPVQN